MAESPSALSEAFQLLISADPGLTEIVMLSLQVSLTATLIAFAIGAPLGALMAVSRFPGRGAVVAVLNALMGLPPVVVGLTVYLLVSNAGALGPLRLIYTPTAMVIAQVLLVAPLIAALSRLTIEDMHEEYDELFRTLRLSRFAAIGTLLWDARFSLATVALAGFGRAIAEVGAVLIVGGNIAHVTRVMTTAIALETSKGELSMALGLGIILIAISVAVNAAVGVARASGRRMAAI
jgi:tungstate transport system permease protein